MMFLKRKYQQPPPMWGPRSAVEAAVRENAHKIYGFDPDSVTIAIPVWDNQNSITKEFQTILNYGVIPDTDIVASGVPVFENKWSQTNITDRVHIAKPILSQEKGTYFIDFTRSLGYNHPGSRVLLEPYDAFLNIENTSNNSTHELFFGTYINSLQINFYPNLDGSSGVYYTFDTNTIFPSAGVRRTIGVSWENGTGIFGYLDGSDYGVPVGGNSWTSSNWTNEYTYFRTQTSDYYQKGLTHLQIGLTEPTSADQQALLHDHKYGLFLPIKRRTYFMPMGGASGLSFLFSPTNQTVTSNLQVHILRSLIVQLANNTTTSAILHTLSSLISFVLNMANVTTTEDIEAKINRALKVDLSNITNTSLVVQNILRNLNISIENQATISDLIHTVLRLLVMLTSNDSATPGIIQTVSRDLKAALNNDSATSDINALLDSLIQFIFSLNNQATTATIQTNILRVLQLALINNTDSTELVVQVLRQLKADISNTTDIATINALLAGIKYFGLSISNTTTTATISQIIIRQLGLTLSNNLNISDIENLLIRALKVSFLNDTDLSDIDQQIFRDLSASLTNSTITPDTLRLILSTLGQLINISGSLSTLEHSGQIVDLYSGIIN